MKQAATLLFLLALTGTVAAQVDPNAFDRQRQQMREQFDRQKDQVRRQYDEERKKAEAEYAAFRKKANEDYAASVQRAWTSMRVQPAVPKPKEPAPPRPTRPVPDRIPTTINLPQAEVVPAPAQLPPVPLPPIPEPEAGLPTMQFAVYGTSCSVHADATDLRFKLSSVDEKRSEERRVGKEPGSICRSNGMTVCCTIVSHSATSCRFPTGAICACWAA